MHDKPTELGRQLAEEFSASLRKQSHLVVDLGESLRAVAADRLLSGSLGGADVTRCYDNEVGGAVVVEETIGYSFPSCTYCPGVQYSEAASKAKIRGRVLLSAVIAADGSATRISIIRGLPCGLNQQGINSVAQWRCKPATDPEGRPAAVRQTIEVTFHVQ